MSTRKKKEKPLSQPFKFADPETLIATLQQLLESNVGPRTTSNLIIWNHKTHIPAYALGEMSGDRLNELALVASYSSQVPYWFTRIPDSNAVKTYMELWKNGHYFHVMRARAHTIVKDYSLQREWGQAFENAFDHFVGSTSASAALVPLYTNTPASSTASLVRRFWNGEGTDMTKVGSKVVKEGEFKEATYVTSRYFIMYCKRISLNSAAQDFTRNWVGNEIERMYAPIPLCTLVMKKEDVRLVRASWLMNEPLEASTFELWVDKSLEDENSPHPLRTQYVRSIRNPLIKQGIKVVVKDDLYKECFKSMDIPKFKTINEEKEWVEARVEKVLSEERRRLGIKKAAPASTTAAMAAAAEFPF